MKKLLILSSVVMAAVACNNTDYSGKKGSNESGTQSTTTTTSDGNPSYDPQRGSGKFTKVDVSPNLDAAKADAGEKVFSVKCNSCHKLTQEKLVGPGWKDVTHRHTVEWIMNFATNPDEILNKDISIWGDVITCPVVGVLKDFNNRSFRDKPAPLLITTNKTMYNQASIKLATTNITSTMKAVKNLWEQTFPDFVFEYKFLDEKIDRFYKQENQMSQLYKIFAAIAIFLSCLGLYGLASFMAVQRVKEVGIRKVLGASAAHIVYLFSREFILLIAIAFAIATPIAWYYMHTWLQGYAYRISISWWIFVAGGLAAVFIALATISFQAIKAARANPVKSLRSE